MNKRVFNSDNVCHFVLLPERTFERDPDGTLRERSGSLSFRTYTDIAGVFGRKGAGVMYVDGIDQNGRPKGKNFTIGQSHNAFVVRKDQADVNEISMFDFIANSPFCLGSPNGTYVDDETAPDGKRQTNAYYKLMDSEGDAEIALDATERRAKAQLSAFTIDEDTLVEVAAIGLGLLGPPTKIMRHKVVEWSGKRPADYFEILESGDRLYRAIIRKAIAEGTLTVKGSLIYWNLELIGGDENAAIKYLLDNKDVLNALQEAVDLKATVKPKKGGNKKVKV